MKPETRKAIAALGTELSPDMLGGTSKLMASFAAAPDPQVTVIRDSFYGPNERNRLDIFTKGRPAKAPVLVYVHGGGFVMGDKTSEGSPFYDNVGQWAAQQGFVGVTMTYRLAPAAQWPSGPEDMTLAVEWLRENIVAYGGNPEAIVLMGQSAGASHVAAYAATDDAANDIAGAILVSCIYDPTTQPPNPFGPAYYGDNPETLGEARCTDQLIASSLPMLFTVSEFDASDFRAQAVQFTGEWFAAKGTYPPMEFLQGHNHLTPAQAIGSAEDDLGPRVKTFIEAAVTG